MNILILEDEQDSRELLEMLLKRSGHKTKAVGSVLQAFEHIRKSIYNLVLMDIGLPGLDGLSFTRKIKKYPHLRDIPIIAVSGQPQELMEGNALRAGCDAFLQKPVDAQVLLDTITKFENLAAEAQAARKFDDVKK